MSLFSGLAEFERDLIRDRTHVGRAAALERGVKFGRPAKMTDEQLKLARRLLKQGKSIRYTADVFGGTFHCSVSISSMTCRDSSRPV